MPRASRQVPYSTTRACAAIVILPGGNVPHLMLRDDVIAAVERGSFHICAVRTLDEAFTLLTGLECGNCDPTGAHPEGVVQRTRRASPA